MPHLKPTHFDVTKHSDYFVWKDTSECIVRCWDDTVDKKRVNSCVLKDRFWREFSNFGGSWATKNIAIQKNLKCSVQRATNVKFSKLTRKKSTQLFDTALCAIERGEETKEHEQNLDTSRAERTIQVMVKARQHQDGNKWGSPFMLGSQWSHWLSRQNQFRLWWQQRGRRVERASVKYDW